MGVQHLGFGQIPSPEHASSLSEQMGRLMSVDADSIWGLSTDGVPPKILVDWLLKLIKL